jgi:hypothetical protein
MTTIMSVNMVGAGVSDGQVVVHMSRPEWRIHGNVRNVSALRELQCPDAASDLSLRALLTLAMSTVETRLKHVGVDGDEAYRMLR